MDVDEWHEICQGYNFHVFVELAGYNFTHGNPAPLAKMVGVAREVRAAHPDVDVRIKYFSVHSVHGWVELPESRWDQPERREPDWRRQERENLKRLKDIDP